MTSASLCEICEAPILRRSAGRTASTCCSPPCRIKRRKEDARVRAREWRRANPEAAAERDRQYREANKELVAARKRAYAQANAERESARKKAWYIANRDRIRAEWAATRTAEDRAEAARRTREWAALNPERKAENYRQWRLSNPERTAAAYLRRRARLRSVEADNVALTELLEDQDSNCYLCSDAISPEFSYPHPLSPSIDHVVPLVRGGSGLRDNLRAAHLRCNLQKGTRLLEELA